MREIFSSARAEAQYFDIDLLKPAGVPEKCILCPALMREPRSFDEVKQITDDCPGYEQTAEDPDQFSYSLDEPFGQVLRVTGYHCGKKLGRSLAVIAFENETVGFEGFDKDK